MIKNHLPTRDDNKKQKFFDVKSVRRFRHRVASLLIGAFAGMLFMSFTVIAAAGIKSVSFNSSKIIFNGKTVDLKGERLVSVVPEGSNSADTYIPMRAALEGMGFKVSWDAARNAVIIGEE